MVIRTRPPPLKRAPRCLLVVPGFKKKTTTAPDELHAHTEMVEGMFNNNRQVNIKRKAGLGKKNAVSIVFFLFASFFFNIFAVVMFYFIEFFVKRVSVVFFSTPSREQNRTRNQVTAVYANAGIYRDHTRSWHVGVSHRHHPSSTLVY